MKPIRHLTAPLSGVLLLVSAGAFAQAYPTKPVTLIVPFPAGGTTDLIARPIAQKLSERLGQTVIIDNRGGAGGTLGAGLVAKSPPDGHTLLVGTVHHTIATSLYKKLPYTFDKDFAPITVTAFVPNILIVNPALKVNSVKDIIALAKAEPNKLTFGSAGSGTSQHLAGEMFKTMAGVEITHVPYKGGAPMMTDLMGGQIDMAFETSASATPQLKVGKVRAIAVTTAERLPTLPDVPTIAESGLPDYQVLTWYSIVAPAATPKEIVTKLHAEISGILKTPEMEERIASIGAQPGGNTPEQFAELIKAETVKWAKVVKDSGATPD